ncbi:glutamine--fructose-6-phosphate transaminase (isomerizing) [Lachnospiraceae bacterium MD1]|uniref:Glutamine--fructose-6-phosphate aminotransferase [isomerizing] n=1 Tax=Variimorphobacter saccharofermentans TaxID=2755051 RepID=A0A839K525_9FIRM|nr:glutamine--fructose-6-phosphate transaminase (isomerizing) [Variimorphobacter saccharofermentans]MBB2183771.1 glutamine--fructose-6-phosphate transaminase (isomerizing) [Variimorphobacter saccharofermentans]
MCGIVGYIGKDQAAPILLDGLSKLEYRGYDSAGLAVSDGTKIQISKCKGRLKVLSELTNGGLSIQGTMGIGHTRWATHGAPSDTNSHPHYNSNETIAVVHNGIIENYSKIKKRLEEKGYAFQSQTDTEVVVQLLDYYYKGDALETIAKVMTKLEGSYALGIMFMDRPNEFYAVRKDSPLIVGVSENGNYIASDVPAILKYTRSVYYIENGEIVTLTRDKVSITNSDLEPIEKELKTVEWDITAAEKGGYEHFMLKEIHEQPKAVRDTIMPRIRDNDIVIDELNMSEEDIKNLKKIYIVACGSAYHTGMTGKYVIEDLARIPVEVDLASEFRYRNPILEKGTLTVIISQSGETADSLAALREAKKQGIKVLGIVNVVGSSIAREADNVMYTWAGPEIAVATTKAYSTQIAALYLLALRFAKVRGTITEERFDSLLQDLCKLPEQIQTILDKNVTQIQYIASKFVAVKDSFFIGRGVDYATALEGSLKLKEISYIHSEAYPAGELKHGPIALIEEDTLVTALLTQESLYKKTISNIVEVQSRGAFVLAVTNEGNEEAEKVSNMTIYIPTTDSHFTTSLAVIPLQLLSYYVSVGKGLDLDKPRNLAKSVTVE